MNHQLYRAASSGDLSFFRNLTKVDTLLHVTTENNTVLHIAVQCDHLQVAEKIVQLCPKLLYQINSNDNTPLHVAAMVGRISMVSLLINHTKNLEIEIGAQNILRMVNAVGDTALHIAVRYSKSKVVREIIKEDPGLAMIRNNFGDSALFLAVDRKLDKIAYDILRASAADCSYAGRDGMNVLHALVIRTRGKFLSLYTTSTSSFHPPLFYLFKFFQRQLVRGRISPAYLGNLEYKQFRPNRLEYCQISDSWPNRFAHLPFMITLESGMSNTLCQDVKPLITHKSLVMIF